jgi:uncharacterized membrane protein
MMKFLFLWLGQVIAKAGYGKKAKDHDCFKIGIFFTLCLIFWMLCMIFTLTGTANNDSLTCIIVDIAVPVIIVLWILNARGVAKKEIAADEERAKNPPKRLWD